MMNNICRMVIENAEEAKNIIKAQGGKVYFVEGLKDCEDEEAFMNDNELPDLILVALGDESLEEVYVCAAMVNERGHIEFLCYSEESGSVFWAYAASCAYHSDNSVYEYLDALFNK